MVDSNQPERTVNIPEPQWKFVRTRVQWLYNGNPI